MSVTASRFKKEFPEFKRTDDNLCQQKLDMAARRVNSTLYGTRTDDGIMYLAAHLLSMAPEGEQARLKAENRATTYERTWKALQREVTMGAGRLI